MLTTKEHILSKGVLVKRFFSMTCIIASIVFLAGCASTSPMGALYTEAKLPLTATSSTSSSKEGTSICTSILGLVATGDCSIEAAAKAGNINSIQSVDSKVFSVLGIYSTYTTVVKGN